MAHSNVFGAAVRNKWHVKLCKEPDRPCVIVADDHETSSAGDIRFFDWADEHEDEKHLVTVFAYGDWIEVTKL